MDAFSKFYLPLEEEELAFIEKKLGKEQKSFWVVMRSLLIMGILIPVLAMIIFKSLSRDQNQELLAKQFPDYYYLITLAILLALVALAGCYSYYMTVRKIAKDSREKLKIIERTTIRRKVYMKENETYHFYINAKSKLSIEVSLVDFESYQTGDEINIEYSKNAREYFGYF